MSRQSNGTYIQPANTAAVSATTISSTAFNTLITDIGAELTNSVDRLGRSAMQAALPMGSNKITGMADPSASTDGATKNYVDTVTAAFFSTGDVKVTIKSVADTGWVMLDDGTIGSASSGASNRANNDTQALFTLIFNNITDTYAPIFTSGGGATTRAAQTNAASAWAANCRISLPKAESRAIGVAGLTSATLTGRTLGQTVGEETHTLAVAEIPQITSNNPTQAITVNSNKSGIPYNTTNSGNTGSGGSFNGPYFAGSISIGVIDSSGSNNITVTSQNTLGSAHNNMQPTIFLNAMMKL